MIIVTSIVLMTVNMHSLLALFIYGLHILPLLFLLAVPTLLVAYLICKNVNLVGTPKP